MAMNGAREQGQGHFLIVGGGVAGITAALDLANLGFSVSLVEKEAHLGGQVAKLDKLYPTDHCAFCPLWTEIKKCTDHPHIACYKRTTIKGIEQAGARKKVRLSRNPGSVDEEKCVYCGRCVEVCPVEIDMRTREDHHLQSHAIRPLWDHAYPPVYTINEGACTKCGVCEEVCPTGAIALHQGEEEVSLTVEEILWATGFREADLSQFEEFGYGTHPDILGSLEFEDWTSEAGPNKGDIRRKSDFSVPKNIAFVQCVGARDRRRMPYCSAVCCMHALKQIHWIAKRRPEIRCTVFFTDLRTVGKHYYAYARAAMDGGNLELLRGRPAMILPLPGTNHIGIKYENTVTQKVELGEFDMVVLNGALVPELSRSGLEPGGMPPLDPDGFLRKEKNTRSPFGCGFGDQPADVIESVIQASSEALKALLHSQGER